MDKCIVISHPKRVYKETDLVKHLFENGLSYYHLRKPGWNSRELEEMIKEIPDQFHSNIIIHDHYDLVKKYNLKGIHLTEKNKEQGYENQYENYSVSISLHSPEELLNLDSTYQYAFLSPVFNSISKPNHESKFDLGEIQQYLSKTQIQVPVIALGGVDLDNIPLIQKTGFDGFAVLGGIWKDYIKHNDCNDSVNKFLAMQDYIKTNST